MKRSPAGFSTVITLLLVAAVLVAAAASFGVYRWQHHKVNDLSAQLSTVNAQMTNLRGQVSTLTSRLGQACHAATSNQPAGSGTPAANCATFGYSSPKGVNVLLFAPAKDAKVASPLAVVGEVPGNWSFESQFPVLLKDLTGTLVAQTTAHVLGNWQTSELVPFSAQLTYDKTPTGSGTLVLAKDNPSGEAKNADSVTIPIHF